MRCHIHPITKELEMHHKDVCQYGYVHSQCRCPGDKTINTIVCDDPSHAEPVSPQPTETKPFELTIDIVAQLVAAHVSGIKDANPTEVDKAIATKMLTAMERELFHLEMSELPADPIEFAVNNPVMRGYLATSLTVQAIKLLRATYTSPYLGLRDAKNICDEARTIINRETLEHVGRTARGLD